MMSEAAKSEPYWAGVRRRLRDGLLTIASLLISTAAIFAVYEASHSAALGLVTAILCGVVTERAIGVISPIVGLDDISKSGKALWVGLMAPCLLVLAAVMTYSVFKGVEGTTFFGAALVAWLFGSVASATHRVVAGKASE